MKCADFQLTVSSVAQGPSFRILDLTADATFTARRVAKEEEKETLAESGEDEAEIVGDRQSKIYYPVDCEVAKEINEANRTTFKTAIEAEKAGYKPTKECK